MSVSWLPRRCLGVPGKPKCTTIFWATYEPIRMRKTTKGLENPTPSLSVWRPHCCLCEHSSILQGSSMLGSMWEKMSHTYNSTHLWPWPPVFPFHDSWLPSSLCAWQIPSHALRFSSKIVFLMMHNPTPPSSVFYGTRVLSHSCDSVDHPVMRISHPL